MVPNVRRACRTDAELTVVADVVRVALGAEVAPQPVSRVGGLAVQQRVSVLDGQQALVRAIHEGVVGLAFKEVEVLVVDGRQLGIVGRWGVCHKGVLPSVVDEATREVVVFVAVLLVHVECAHVTVLEEVVAVAGVLALEVALGVVCHDAVEDVLQSSGRAGLFLVGKALGEFHVSPPIQAGGLVVVLPIHQRTASVELICTSQCSCGPEGQARGFVGVDVNLGHQVGALVGIVHAGWRPLELFRRQEIGVVQGTVDFP